MQFSTLLVIGVMTSHVVIATSLKGCSSENDTDYPQGPVLKSIDGIGSEQACCDVCKVEIGCSVWTFEISTTNCLLKTSSNNSFTNIGMTSGRLVVVPDPRNPADADEAVCTGGPDYGACKYTFH